MMTLSRRKSWLTFLFTTYGVPALLMIAVLPVNHAKACACIRAGIPMIQSQQPMYCPACAFLHSTPLNVPEAAVSAAAPEVLALHEAAFDAAPLSYSPHRTNRAHSPPFA